MFLKTVMERNQPLVRLGIEWQQNGVILPDTYLLDYDTILENARSIKQAGDANGVQNFFMLKQIGRNPLIARALTDMGYVGAVCVDFREALTMVENQIPLGNVGHLVQIPRAALKKILRAKPVIVTVYTLEKAREISAVCTELGLHQKLMLRVLGEGDMLYSGQYGGFELQELDSAVRAIEAMPNVEVGGVCSFPCFLYDEAAQDILPMPNLRTVQTAAEMLRPRLPGSDAQYAQCHLHPQHPDDRGRRPHPRGTGTRPDRNDTVSCRPPGCRGAPRLPVCFGGQPQSGR